MSPPDRSNVPKFGSFKRKASAAEDAHSSRESKRPRSRSSSPDRGTRRSEHRTTSHVRDKARVERSAMRSDRESLKPFPAEPQPRLQADADDTFFVDRRGDVRNVDFGSLHRYSIPSHHRRGAGRVIGVPTAKIDRDDSSHGRVALTQFDQRPRPRRQLLSKREARLLSHARLIIPVQDDGSIEANDDFLPLDADGLIQDAPADEEPIAPHSTDYRSIEGKATNERRVTDGIDEELHDDIWAEDRASRQENAVLLARARESRTDLSAWMAVVDHQIKLVHSGRGIDTLTNHERRMLAEVRIAIYESALKRLSPGISEHDELTEGLMWEGQLVWSHDKVHSKWQKFIEYSPQSIKLRLGMLLSIATNMTSANFDFDRKAFTGCLRALNAIRQQEQANIGSDVPSVQVSVFLYFTKFIKDAGYDELAIALWQALLELQFCTLPAAYTIHKNTLRSLEEFWDEEAPRIGELDANGWCTRSNGDKDRAIREGNAHRPIRTTASRKDGVINEAEAIAGFHLPTSTDQEGSTDDPYCYIMFSDLQEIIEQLQAPLPPHTLINAFLTAMDFPPLLSHGLPASLDDRLNDFLSSAAVDDRQELDNFQVSAHYYRTSFDLFDHAFDRLTGTKTSSLAVEKAAFVDRALGTLSAIRSDDDTLAEYLLALRASTFPSDAAKYAKRILKARPTCLRMYNAYALSEACGGRLEKGWSVWTSAVGLLSGMNDHGRRDGVLLYHSACMYQMRCGNERLALDILLAAPSSNWPSLDKSPVDAQAPSRLMAAVVYFRESIYHRRHSSDDQVVGLHIECLFWLCYLTNRHEIDPIQEELESLSDMLKGQISAIEQLHQARARIMRHHLAQQRHFKVSDMLAMAMESMRAFPDNSIIVALYFEVQARMQLTDRLRTSLTDTQPQSTFGIVYWTHAIAAETRRQRDHAASGSTQHSVRTLYRQALLNYDSKVKHSQLLWRQWLAFERGLLDEDAAQRAKQVFYDGMRALPCSKTWIVLGMKDFLDDGQLTDMEVKQLYDSMREREMRIRYEPDED